MRAIAKGPEPASLTLHRLANHTDYDNYPDKDRLRQSLVQEQRGLCCYCLSRICADRETMRIEHWHSQSQFPLEQLRYINLLGACMGTEGTSPTKQHCDVSKADRTLSRNPANPIHLVENLIHYKPDGHVSSTNATFDAELNDVLNLNIAFLVNNRKAMLDSFKTILPKNVPRAAFEKLLQKWNGEIHCGDLEPFCQVVVYWLSKRLARP